MIKDIVGYESRYVITSEGRVWSKIGSGRWLKLCNNKGYLYINTYNNNINKKLKVHRLVAEAFIPNPENKPQVNHINGIKTDNRVENLEWVTSSENIQHAFDTNLKQSLKGELHGKSKLTWDEVNKIRQLYNSKIKYTQANLGKIYNVSSSMIHLIVTNKNWVQH